jgi:hypothetical protein
MNVPTGSACGMVKRAVFAEGFKIERISEVKDLYRSAGDCEGAGVFDSIW